LPTLGLAAALAAALCRVVTLLITRAALQQADARMITWYTFVSSTALFTVLALAVWDWQAAATQAGWLRPMVLALTNNIASFPVYLSTARIGPCRTALFMNLEPLLTAVGSAIFLGEVLNALQMLGGAIMLTALAAFQMRR